MTCSSRSQDTPLWHLAGYARRQNEVKTLADWRRIKPFNNEKQFLGVRDGKVAKGTPFRILGTFIMGRTFAAEANPLGIQKWTEAHIQIRELGGKIVPLWIPEDIGTDWQINATVEARGYLFKRYRFQSRDGARGGPRCSSQPTSIATNSATTRPTNSRCLSSLSHSS